MGGEAEVAPVPPSGDRQRDRQRHDVELLALTRRHWDDPGACRIFETLAQYVGVEAAHCAAGASSRASPSSGRSSRSWIREEAAASHSEFDAIRAAIAAGGEEADLRADLTTYRANNIAGQVERDDAWEAESDRIADAEPAARRHPPTRHERAHAFTAMPRNVHRDDKLEPCPACGRAFVHGRWAPSSVSAASSAPRDRPAVDHDPVRHGGSQLTPGSPARPARVSLVRPAVAPATPTTERRPDDPTFRLHPTGDKPRDDVAPRTAGGSHRRTPGSAAARAAARTAGHTPGWNDQRRRRGDWLRGSIADVADAGARRPRRHPRVPEKYGRASARSTPSAAPARAGRPGRRRDSPQQLLAVEGDIAPTWKAPGVEPADEALLDEIRARAYTSGG